MPESRKPSGSSLDDLLSQTHIPGRAQPPGQSRKRQRPKGAPGGPKKPLIPEKHYRGLLMLAFALVLALGAWIWHSQPEPEGLADRKDDFPVVADFKTLQPTGQHQVWFAEVNESFVYMSALERKERCQIIIKLLPVGEVESLLLMDNAGVSVTCVRPSTERSR